MPSDDPAPAASKAQQPTPATQHPDAQAEHPKAPPVTAEGGTTDAP